MRSRSTSDTQVGSTVGERLEQAIREFYPTVSVHPAVLELAAHTDISVSQINRIRSGKTTRPHPKTLRVLAEALNTTDTWLRDGVHEEQLDVFAAVVPTVEEARRADPAAKVRALLNELGVFPREVQVRACRAAVSAMLNAFAGAGQVVPEAYQSLVYLDVIESVTRRTAGKTTESDSAE